MASKKRSRRRSSSSSSEDSFKPSRKYRRKSRRSRSSMDYSKMRRYSSSSSSSSRSPSPCYMRRVRFYGTRDNPYKSKVLGVFGLSQATNEARLMDIFSPFGAVEHIALIYDAKTGNSRGFGFIYYSQMHEASKARKEINGSTIDGRRIRVDFSITKRAHTPTPGVYMGLRGDDKHEHKRNRHRSRSRSRDRNCRHRYSTSRSRR